MFYIKYAHVILALRTYLCWDNYINARTEEIVKFWFNYALLCIQRTVNPRDTSIRTPVQNVSSSHHLIQNSPYLGTNHIKTTHALVRENCCDPNGSSFFMSLVEDIAQANPDFPLITTFMNNAQSVP
ncbi:hypothetical protein EYC80_004906 [Monilinia laxa]|uniref:Uncharacterized protein n=1 Tax=Monilinia laxa TaxID=61186 RepID=A0A5N6KIG3_MONLA|nr:hypothetical protein EYC80_004906 [Monilinia laxa]